MASIKRDLRLMIGVNIKEYGINNISARQSIAYRFAKRKNKGFWYCIKRLIQELYLRVFSNLFGLLAWPVCYFMKIIFVPFYVRSIGHLCKEPECYIKEEILGIRPKYTSIVLAPRGTVANQQLLEYWKRYNIKVIESPVMCALLEPLSKNRFTVYNVEKYVFDYSPLFPEIRKKYSGGPLLKLSEHDRKYGWKVLENIGVPKEAWFVCVYCREDGYLGDVDQSNRNCDINGYLPEIEAITKEGGWVIRMGDAKMKEIPPMKNVVDYAHTKIKSDWMDVFLSASCRFFLGCNSGLSHLPTIFGVPSAIANCVPMSGVLSYGDQAIGIPKLVWSISENRCLTFKEIFDSPISNYRWDSSFAKAGVKLIDNSPEDILGLAMEVMDKAKGKILYTDRDNDLQERFKSLMRPGHYSYGAVSRLGRDFLRKYAYLLKG